MSFISKLFKSIFCGGNDVVKAKKVEAVDNTGLSLNNLSGQGIHIGDDGLVNIEPRLCVKAHTDLHGPVMVHGPIDVFGKFLGVIQLSEGAMIGQLKKTGITGTDEEVGHLVQTDGNSCVMNYVVKDGSKLRTGTIKATWNGPTLQYSQSVTDEFGDTSPLTLELVTVGINIELRASANSGTWEVRTTFILT